jgi:hypothetical protein
VLVITAVGDAPGTVRRKGAKWHAIAETAIMPTTAIPSTRIRGRCIGNAENQKARSGK